MAFGPITSWQIDGETMETMTDFIFLGSKITADCDCSHEIKRCLLLARKVMTNLDSILKSRDITLWQIDGETMETMTDFIYLFIFSDFIFWGFKITVDGDCSHGTKRYLFLGTKVMTNLDSILKKKYRDTTLPTKVHLAKDMVFPVVMYGCERVGPKRGLRAEELMF